MGLGLGLALGLPEREWGCKGDAKGRRGLQVSGNEVSRRQGRQKPIVQKDAPGTKMSHCRSAWWFLEGEGGLKVRWPCLAAEGEVCLPHRTTVTDTSQCQKTRDWMGLQMVVVTNSLLTLEQSTYVKPSQKGY